MHGMKGGKTQKGKIEMKTTAPLLLALPLILLAPMTAQADNGDGIRTEKTAYATTAQELPAEVKPLLGKIRWDQYAPYNNLTPVVDGLKTPVGCVATALSTIMRYHQWPTQATGTVSAGHVGRIDLDREGNYDFALMPENSGLYSSDAQTRAEQQQMVAKLCLHVGVATGMEYGTTVSGAMPEQIIPALVEHFKYGKQARYIIRERGSAEEFDNELKASLAAGCPVLMTGYSDTYRHAFVIDGYNAQGQFHVDWGWGGKSNGYYNLDLLNGYDPYAHGQSFSKNIQAIVDICPDRDGTSTVSPQAISVRNYGLEVQISPDGDFQFTNYSVWTRMESDYADRRTPLKVGLAAVPADGGEPIFGKLWYEYSWQLNYDGGDRINGDMPGGKYFPGLPDGNYDILPAMKIGDQAEKLMPFYAGEKHGLRAEVAGGGTQWTTSALPQARAEVAFVEGSVGYQFDDWDGRYVSFALQNRGDKDWSGSVGVKSAIYAGGAVYGEKEIGTAVAQVKAGGRTQVEVAIGGLDGYEFPDIEPYAYFTDADGKEQKIALTQGRIPASGRYSSHSVTTEVEGEGKIEQTEGTDIASPVRYRSKLAFKVTPAEGYETAGFLVNGVPADPAQVVTIFCNTVIKAVFKEKNNIDTGISKPQVGTSEKLVGTSEKLDADVFSLSGIYLGTYGNLSLPKGIYIIGGRKKVVE